MFVKEKNVGERFEGKIFRWMGKEVLFGVGQGDNCELTLLVPFGVCSERLGVYT